MNDKYLNHGQLMTLAGELGYSIDDAGFCFGLTMMITQAMLLNQLDSFLERISLENYRKKKYSKLLTKIKSPNAEDLTDKEKRYLLEIKAFFDGVILYQYPYNHEEILNGTSRDKKFLMQGNSYLSTFDLIKSIPLTDYAINNTLTLTSVYSVEDLEVYLKSLATSIKDDSMVIKLGSMKHGVVLKYNPHNNTWLFVDPNDFETANKEYKSSDVHMLANKIFLSLTMLEDPLPTKVVMSTKVIQKTDIENQKQINTDTDMDTKENLIELLKSNNEWETIHNKSNIMLTATDKQIFSWLKLAMQHNDEHSFNYIMKNKNINPLEQQQATANGCDIDYIIIEDLIRYHNYNMLDLILNDERFSSNIIEEIRGSNKLLNMAIKHNNLKAIKSLVARGAKILKDNEEMSEEMYEPVIEAIRNHRPDLVEAMLSSDDVELKISHQELEGLVSLNSAVKIENLRRECYDHVLQQEIRKDHAKIEKIIKKQLPPGFLNKVANLFFNNPMYFGKKRKLTDGSTFEDSNKRSRRL